MLSKIFRSLNKKRSPTSEKTTSDRSLTPSTRDRCNLGEWREFNIIICIWTSVLVPFGKMNGVIVLTNQKF
ncbi:hypothetical protein [Pseudanabaena sp. SR411]|uniref:hypothetical protein n=1 Tax=Pseudanabaena sp. SR411 TaxID=1980935 RepID=UPI0011402437|nr:hypothetical protein [Pseudanabaena sp. SR411]